MTNPILTTEQRIRDLLQPMLHDAQMKSWHEGVTAGLGLAHSMVDAARDDLVQKIGTGNESEQAWRGRHIALLGGLLEALTKTASESAHPDAIHAARDGHSEGDLDMREA